VHTRICAGDKTQYRRRIGHCLPGIKLITDAYYIYSPGVTITLEGVALAHLIPGAYELSSPVVSQVSPAHMGCMRGINIPKGHLSRCGPTSQYRRRIHFLCAGDNGVSPANSKLCARGNFTTGESIWGAPAIVLLAIRNSLLVHVRMLNTLKNIDAIL
jgi:hypothetical protein